ncbi:hypothetical protein BDP81DRAFT_512826, partial [Colletotrichum phormii]
SFININLVIFSILLNGFLSSRIVDYSINIGEAAYKGVTTMLNSAGVKPTWSRCVVHPLRYNGTSHHSQAHTTTPIGKFGIPSALP